MTHAYVEHQCYQYKLNADTCKKTSSAPSASHVSTISSTISSSTSVRPSQSTISLFSTLNIWMQRSRQRKQLAQLDQHLLDDIGLSAEMVAKEIAKPFWK